MASVGSRSTVGERSRETGSSSISLRPLTSANVRAVCDLKLAPGQEEHVCTPATAIAEALVAVRCSCQVIVLNGWTPIGVIVIEDYDDSWWLWRMMIDASYQGNGYGRRALRLLFRQAQRGKVSGIGTSVLPGGPVAFYESLGFLAQGTDDDGTTLLSLLF